jgi:cytochrome c-type biogenesis protein CcmH/NrfF
MSEVNKVKTFKEYYLNDDYKKKHLEYIKEKVSCPNCKTEGIARCNMTHHRRTTKCIDKTALLLKLKEYESQQEEINNLVDKMQELKNRIENKSIIKT